MKHTPRPWGFGNTHEGQRLILGANGTGPYVCSVQIHQTPRRMGMMDEEEREANAQLIKAAPDMLEALQLALIKLQIFRSNTNGEYQGGMEFSSLQKKIQKAIAKAEGKS